MRRNREKGDAPTNPPSLGRGVPQGPTERSHQGTSQTNAQNPPPNVNLTPFQCPHCERAFTTRSGLGLHKHRSHRPEANEQIMLPKSKRVGDEEIHLIARAEAEAMRLEPPPKFINKHLITVFPDKKLESIKQIGQNTKESSSK